jgi:hypothetical protein
MMPTATAQMVEKLMDGFKEQWAPMMENLDIAEQASLGGGGGGATGRRACRALVVGLPSKQACEVLIEVLWHLLSMNGAAGEGGLQAGLGHPTGLAAWRASTCVLPPGL